jgi:predicted alpha/beta hydrolase family esterase
MATALIVPGLNDSPEGHWQTLLQNSLQDSRRVEQDDWDAPNLEAWLERFASVVGENPDAVIVAHSLGCILVAHAATRFPALAIRGALLVAPADVDSAIHTPPILRNFAPVPIASLSFPNIVVASCNDPFIALSRARMLAEAWGSRFVNIGAAGHINIASGHGFWPAAREFFDDLVAPAEYNQSPAPLLRLG